MNQKVPLSAAALAPHLPPSNSSLRGAAAKPTIPRGENLEASSVSYPGESPSDKRPDDAVGSKIRGAPVAPSIVSGLVGVSDCLCMISVGLITYFFLVDGNHESFANYGPAILLATFAIITVFYLAGLYGIDKISRFSAQLKMVIRLCALVFLLLVTLSFALNASEQFSRIWVFLFFLLATLTICTSRAGFAFLLKKGAQSGRLARNVVIVGAGDQANLLIERLKSSAEPWNVIIGIFDDRTDRIKFKAWGCPILGNVDDLFGFVRKFRIDEVIITLPWSAERRVGEIVNRLSELPVYVRLAPDLVGFAYRKANYETVGGMTMLGIASKPLAGWRVVLKTLEDKILAMLLLTIFSPLMAFIALAIKIDSKGPILFRQRRYGYNNKEISICKFRTMKHNGVADEGALQAVRDDARVTRVGRILRRTSLDELPQLLNVLDGSMSLVGPRPHPVPLNERFASVIRGYYARHRMKPGITGWAQANGLRGETDSLEKMKARVELDIEYIENWSISRDLYILAKTAYTVWVQDTAY
jgi:Undecaprenyl-phosphate glucose phosphotransferase